MVFGQVAVAGLADIEVTRHVLIINIPKDAYGQSAEVAYCRILICFQFLHQVFVPHWTVSLRAR
jgi:hypothetical protein